MPTLARNKDAAYKYDLEEKFEAGIQLKGPEVKSVRAGHVQLTGSYARLTPRGAELIGCQISPYKMARENPPADRTRRLLLQQSELLKLQQRLRGQALTLVPMRLYTRGGFIKVELALAKGRKKADKRQRIKERDVARRISRALRPR